MVYKTDKRRVHSGNTLRASNSRYNRQYRRQSFLVRQSQNVAKVTTILEDLGLNKDDVAYSLNKKGRWLVPQLLKHEILSGSQTFDDIKINLVESHKLKKQVKCTGFHSNNGCVRRMIPKKKTYFNVRSVLGLQTETTSPKVTVNVLYPCPETSSISHNPKYIRVEEYTPEEFDLVSTENTSKQSNPIKSKSKKHRRKIGTKQRLNDFLDDVEYLENEEYDFDDASTSDDVRERSNTVSIADILGHSRRLQNLLLGETMMKKPTHRHSEFKDRKVYMDKAEEDMKKNDVDKTIDQEAFPPTALTNGVKVFIPNSDVTPERLLDTYGKDYTECHCYPRKFIIDITKRVKRTITNSKAFHDNDTQSAELSAALVFVYDMYDGLDSAELSLFEVFLNMNTKRNHSQMNTLLGNDVIDVEGVISRAALYTETIPYDQFVHRLPPYHYSRRSATDFEMLNECIEATRTIFTLEWVTVQDIIHNGDDTTRQGTPQAGLGFETLPPDICSICFESILEGSATALQTCGHWFCNCCWNGHVIASANDGSGRITCPEYNCKEKVDFTILLTTSPLRLVERVLRRNRNMMVETNSDIKWCPNKKCQRVVKYEKTKKGNCSNITCDCGTEMCFECLQPAHWPLACDQYTSYAAQLRKNGDDKIIYVTPSENRIIDRVRGKTCPNCKRFVEKNGGCFYMTCVCNTSFCWGCGCAFPAHVLTSACRAFNRRTDGGNGYRTTAVALIDEVKTTAVTSNAYKHALQNRLLRQPANVRKMSSAVHGISQKLMVLNRRHGNRVGGELVKFKPCKSIGDRSVRAKFVPFLHSMVSVYVEIAHVTEYTTVFMANADNMAPIESSKHLLPVILDRLEGLGQEIVGIFRSASQEDPRNCISRLLQVRFQSRKAIDNLIKLISC